MVFPATAQLDLLPVDPPSAPSVPGTGSLRGGAFGPGGLVAPDSGARFGAPGFPFSALDAAPLPSAAGGRTVTLTPSLAVEGIYNDNIRYTARNREEDYILRLTPGVRLGLDTARLTGTLAYNPGIDFYAYNSDQNRVAQRFNGQASGTVVPNLFFVDFRGAASVQSLSGGFAPESEAEVARDNQVQTYTFGLSPYVVQRFRGLATARLGYNLQYVNQDRADASAALPTDQPASSFTPSEYTSHQGYLVVRSGEDFGRLALQGTLSGTVYDGGGLYDGAYRNIALVESRYAINRSVAALAELGYETQKFNTVPQTDIADVVWAIGARLTPGPLTTITGKYGRRDGFGSFFLDSRVGLGVRTSLFANYVERLTSSALQAGDLLSTTTLDALGNPVDAATGQPVIPSIANSSLSVQSGLVRQTTASLGLSQTWPRDTVRFTITQTEREPVADAPGQRQRSFTQKGTSFSLRWTHALAEGTNLTAFGQYGLNTSSNAPDTTTYSAGLSLSQRLTQTLTGALSYRLNIRDGGGGSSTSASTGDDRAVQNIITAGLRQSF